MLEPVGERRTRPVDEILAAFHDQPADGDGREQPQRLAPFAAEEKQQRRRERERAQEEKPPGAAQPKVRLVGGAVAEPQRVVERKIERGLPPEQKPGGE